MGSPERYGALLSRWKWVIQQLGDVADIVQPCQQSSFWSLAAATCPPIGQLCVDGVMGLLYGPSLRGQQDRKLFGTVLPIIPCEASLLPAWYQASLS